ncbi:MAG: hypothetical protein WB755_20215, partial [Terriglobales bacterium]
MVSLAFGIRRDWLRWRALVRIELLLDYRLCPRLLSSRLMLRLELDFAELTDSDHRNVLDPLYDAKIALGHEYSLPQFAGVKRYRFVARAFRSAGVPPAAHGSKPSHRSVDNWRAHNWVARCRPASRRDAGAT